MLARWIQRRRDRRLVAMWERPIDRYTTADLAIIAAVTSGRFPPALDEYLEAKARLGSREVRR